MGAIRLGLIGLGAWAREAYVPVLKELADVDVCAVAAKSEATRTFAREQFGDDIALYDNYAALLQDKNVELGETIHELKETRDRMVQQEKMASLGELAAGATHEINNPLNYIQAGAFALHRRLVALESGLAGREVGTNLAASLDSAKELSNIIVDGCERIEAIVKGLWAVTRQDPGEPESVDLNAELKSTSRLVRSTVESGVEIVLDLGSIPAVTGTCGELNQVLLNLVQNAVEALDGPGQITARTYAEKMAVCVEVADSGRGLPSGEPQRVFDPFFTTKEEGRGRGLGLAICMRIIEQHGGTIRAGNRPEGGALFTVRLPVAESAAVGKGGETQ